jgi:hypothetical protein
MTSRQRYPAAPGDQQRYLTRQAGSLNGTAPRYGSRAVQTKRTCLSVTAPPD